MVERFIECEYIDIYSKDDGNQATRLVSRGLVDLDLVDFPKEGVNGFEGDTIKINPNNTIITCTNGKFYQINVDYETFKELFINYKNYVDGIITSGDKPNNQ